ncbi:MAG: NAD-dependent succinate-semialdehyde dehydrogenase [Saprospiraceae bacterium]|nr:NAD-dependent succinate-semialdehyde dehydrogenase [Saprospiraceae bacterium]
MPSIESINPFTLEVISKFKLHTNQEVREILDQAEHSFQEFKNTSIAYRAERMLKVASILIDKKEKYAKMITEEMGKTFSSAIAEVEKCAWVCQYYAEHASDFLASQPIKTDAQKSMVVYRPLGVLLAVMPWNYPFWQVFRFAAPSIMAGNVAVLKHASNVPQSALFIEDVFREAGFPSFTFTTLLIKNTQVQSIIENPIVKAVSLTGSEKAGVAVASIAGKNIKPSVLELGGSDPYIVLHDADIPHAVEQCITSRLLNAGQSCIGAKRFIIVKEVYDQFLELFRDRMSTYTIGDPMSHVDLGPMARIDLRDEVHRQVCKSKELGAKVILGGEIPDLVGAFYYPTILTDVQPGMPAYSEEIFGPVASVFKAENEEEAIQIANDSSFGLGACIFTEDIERGEYIATFNLDAGACFVNQFVKSDPRLPFGGIKTSGFGRELSKNGIHEFVNIKTIYIK